MFSSGVEKDITIGILPICFGHQNVKLKQTEPTEKRSFTKKKTNEWKLEKITLAVPTRWNPPSRGVGFI